MDAQQQLDSVIASALSSVPGCLACGLVDLDIGSLLAWKQTTSHPSSILEMTAAATQDFFEGDNVKTIERLVADSRGTAGESLIESVFFETRGTLHFMLRGGRGGRQVVVFVCKRDANMGMTKAKGSVAATSIFDAA